MFKQWRRKVGLRLWKCAQEWEALAKTAATVPPPVTPGEPSRTALQAASLQAYMALGLLTQLIRVEAEATAMAQVESTSGLLDAMEVLSAGVLLGTDERAQWAARIGQAREMVRSAAKVVSQGVA